MKFLSQDVATAQVELIFSAGCSVLNCDTCATEYTCRSCYPGYKLSSKFGSCDAICSIPHCTTCSSPSSCESCDANFYLSSKKASCVEDTCIDDENNPHCLKCIVGIKGSCTQCENHYLATSHGVCQLETSQRQATNLQQAIAARQMNDCTTLNCAVCILDICSVCETGYSLNANLDCVVDLGCGDLGCAACTSGVLGSCTDCHQGYILPLSPGVCLYESCDDPSNNPNCISCTTGAPGTCKLCELGYVPTTAGTCIVDTCDDKTNNYGCAECTSGVAQSCTVCYFGLSLTEDKTCGLDLCLDNEHNPFCAYCIAGVENSCLVCDIGYHLTVHGSCQEITCDEDPSLCDYCNELCTECSESNECVSCIDYANLIGVGCECVEYSTFNSASNSCECNSDTINDTVAEVCVPLGDYLEASDYTSVSFTSTTCNSFEVSFGRSVAVVDLTDEEDCSLLFEQSTISILGEGPKCSWNSEKTSLVVELIQKYDFTASPVNIEVNWRHVRQSDLSLDGDYSVLSRTISTSSCPSPEPQLNGPSSYSTACSDNPLELMATTLTGVSKSLVKYSWSVSPTFEGVSELTDSEIQVTVPTDISGDFTFTVTATNAFGQTGLASIAIGISSSELLSTIFDTGPHISIEGGEKIKIKTVIDNDCGASGNPSYVWSYQGTASGTPVTDPDPQQLETSGQKLIITEGDLKPGESYVFSSTASQASLSGAGEVTIEVLPSELVLLLNVGDQDISSGRDFELDASRSEDPDGHPLYFLWVCVYEGTGTPCEDPDGNNLVTETSPLTTESTFLLESSNLVVDDVLVFTVTISTQDGREESKTITLTVKDAGNSYIEIVPIDLHKVLVHLALVIDMKAYGEAVIWKQVAGPSLTPSSLPNLPSVRFEPYSMEENAEYTFHAVLETSGDPLVFEVFWTTNSGPICHGSLSNDHDEGKWFTLSMPDCFDSDEEDYPLTYSFGLHVRDRQLPLSLPTQSSSILGYFFPHSYSVVVEVCDFLGSCITQDKTLDFSQSESGGKLDLQQEFSLAFEGDDDQLAFLVKTFAEEYTYAPDDWDFLYTQLEGYTGQVLEQDSEYEITTATGIVGAVLEMLNKEPEKQTEEQVVQELNLINDVLNTVPEPLSLDT